MIPREELDAILWLLRTGFSPPHRLPACLYYVDAAGGLASEAFPQLYGRYGRAEALAAMRALLARSRASRCYLLMQSWLADDSPGVADELRAETEAGTLQVRPDRRDALVVVALDAEEQIRIHQEIKREGEWVWLDEPVVSTDLGDRELAALLPRGGRGAAQPGSGGWDRSEPMGDEPTLAETLHQESQAVMRDASFAGLLGMRIRGAALMLQAAELERAAAAAAVNTAAETQRADFLRLAAWKFLEGGHPVQAGAIIDLALAEHPSEGIAQDLRWMRDRVRALASPSRAAPATDGA